jgi:hypothetical protein
MPRHRPGIFRELGKVVQNLLILEFRKRSAQMGRPMSQPGGGTARSKSKEDRHSYRHLQPTTWPTIQHVVIPGRTLMKESKSKLANLSGYIGKIDSFDQRFRNRISLGHPVLSGNINKN